MKIKRKVRYSTICLIFPSVFLGYYLFHGNTNKISQLQSYPKEYEAGELEKATWNLSYSPASLKQKGGDPCLIGWPGPGCPRVPEGGMTSGERAAISHEVRKSLASEDRCRFTFQTCSRGKIGERSLKSCAVVGLSDNLRHHGTKIDSHDTVFRIGFLPLERYKDRAGMKTNFTLCRGYKKDVKNCLLPMPIDIYGRSPTQHMYPRGNYGQILILTTLQGLRDIGVRSFPENISAIITSKTKIHYRSLSKGFRKSTGFAFIYYILSSNICDSISIYGFSRERNHPHFFNDIEGGFRSIAPVDAVHSPKFETQLLEMLGVKIF
mgnify:CR=1 FL=1